MNTPTVLTLPVMGVIQSPAWSNIIFQNHQCTCHEINLGGKTDRTVLSVTEIVTHTQTHV